MKKTYCLDTNIFIEPWNKFYSQDFTTGYWETLKKLSGGGTILVTSEVEEEIEKKDDELNDWFSENIKVTPPTIEVQEKLKYIMSKWPKLIDNSSGRSKADPWVIAEACVSKLGVECIDLFEMIRQLKLAFHCKIK